MITYKLIQQRPNTEVDFYTPSDISLSKINEYISAGKINGSLTSIISDNQLIKTLTLEIDDDFYEEILNDVTLSDEVEKRIAYCDKNLISFSVEVT